MKNFAVILIHLFLTVNSYCQNLTLNDIEQDLNLNYSKITYYHEKLYSLAYDSVYEDSLYNQISIFREKLKDYTSLYPLTLNYKFDSLNIEIVTSNDNLFRIYSWDNELGGTMRDFENVIQYKSNGNVLSRVYTDTAKDGEGIYIPSYDTVFTFINSDKTYYLAIGYCIYSNRDKGQLIKVFSIDNNSLNDTTKLFKTKSGFKNEIEIDFDFFNIAKRPKGKELIWYDSKLKTIFIPVVLENGRVTRRNKKLKFTGEYFEEK